MKYKVGDKVLINLGYDDSRWHNVKGEIISVRSSNTYPYEVTIPWSLGGDALRTGVFDEKELDFYVKPHTCTLICKCSAREAVSF